MTTADDDTDDATPPIFALTDDGRATLRLNRPRTHNRLEPEDIVALTDLFDRLATEPAARVMVLTGTGRSFSSGFDIDALAETPDGPDQFARMVDRLEALPIPTIAALNGGVYGGSTDLALACDFRIGVRGMRLVMPAAHLGVVYYASGLQRYVSRVGLDHAKRLFLTGAPADDEALLAMGYLTDLVEPETLEASVDALIEQVMRGAPLALSGVKQSLNDIATARFDAETHQRRRDVSAASRDHREALAAWREKRKPVFTGD